MKEGLGSLFNSSNDNKGRKKPRPTRGKNPDAPIVVDDGEGTNLGIAAEKKRRKIKDSSSSPSSSTLMQDEMDVDTIKTQTQTQHEGNYSKMNPGGDIKRNIKSGRNKMRNKTRN